MDYFRRAAEWVGVNAPMALARRLPLRLPVPVYGMASACDRERGLAVAYGGTMEMAGYTSHMLVLSASGQPCTRAVPADGRQPGPRGYAS